MNLAVCTYTHILAHKYLYYMDTIACVCMYIPIISKENILRNSGGLHEEFEGAKGRVE